MFKTLTDAKLYKDAGYKAFVTSQWVANNACGLIQTTATAVKDYALPVAIASANSASEFYHNMPEDTRNYVRNATLVFGGVSTVAFAASRVAKTMGTSTNGPAKKKQRIENVSSTEANEGVQFKSTNLTADNNSNVSKVTSTTTTNNNNNESNINIQSFFNNINKPLQETKMRRRLEHEYDVAIARRDMIKARTQLSKCNMDEEEEIYRG